MALAVVASLMLVANASALPVYRFYFFRNTDEGGSTGDGALFLYDVKHPYFPGLTKTPDVRAVFPAASGIEPVWFLTAANETHPERIKGAIWLIAYPGPSPMAHGNLTFTVLEVPAHDATIPTLPSEPIPAVPPPPVPLPVPPLPVPLPPLPDQTPSNPVPDPIVPPPLAPGQYRVLAQYNISVDANTSKLPDPTTLVPPQPPPPDPANPVAYNATLQAYAAQVAAFEETKLLPAILTIPGQFIRPIDVTVNATSRIAIMVTATPPAGSDVPLAEGFATFEYDSWLALSYIYIPWYEKDKPGSTYKPPTKTSTSTTLKAPSTTYKQGNSTVQYGDDGKKSPDAGLLLLPALGAIALMMRRRLPR